SGQVQPAAADRGAAGRRGILRGPGRLPAIGGRPAMTGPADRRQPPSARFTGRAALLAVVICAIALSLAYPVREYLAQSRQISALEVQRQSLQAKVNGLAAEQQRL